MSWCVHGRYPCETALSPMDFGNFQRFRSEFRFPSESVGSISDILASRFNFHRLLFGRTRLPGLFWHSISRNRRLNRVLVRDAHSPKYSRCLGCHPSSFLWKHVDSTTHFSSFRTHSSLGFRVHWFEDLIQDPFDPLATSKMNRRILFTNPSKRDSVLFDSERLFSGDYCKYCWFLSSLRLFL